MNQNPEEKVTTEKQDDPREGRWDAYLTYLQQQANRAALKDANFAEGDDDSPDRRRGSIDGKGTIQIVYTPTTDAPPWSDEDLGRYNDLTDGGEWHTLQDDGSGDG